MSQKDLKYHRPLMLLQIKPTRAPTPFDGNLDEILPHRLFSPSSLVENYQFLYLPLSFTCLCFEKNRHPTLFSKYET